MDRTTNIALRAIIRGLRRSGAITEDQLGHIVSALHELEATQREHHHTCDAYDLMRLACELEKDERKPATHYPSMPSVSEARQ